MLIIRNAPLFYVRNIWNVPFLPFSESKRKNGAYQIFRTPKSGVFRIKITWLVFKQPKDWKFNYSILAQNFWGISNKNPNVITWQNHLSHVFWGISYYLPELTLKPTFKTDDEFKWLKIKQRTILMSLTVLSFGIL